MPAGGGLALSPTPPGVGDGPLTRYAVACIAVGACAGLLL